jgi:Protein of unknown function (DUF1822)
MNEVDTFHTFTSPISTAAIKLAKKLSQQQVTPEKSQQVYLNSLAVWFVKYYLDCIGVETDIKESDSMNPAQIMLTDVADLVVKNLGKLECRPVLENAQLMYIPPEAQSERIGYLAVQINALLGKAKIIGFLKEVSIDNLPINQLQPLDYLEFEHMNYQKLQETTLPKNTVVSLRKWLDKIYDFGWQPVDTFLFNEPAWQFRSFEQPNMIERAKLINIGLETHHESVVIVVKIKQDELNVEKMHVYLELHPSEDQEYLPPSLHVMILNEEGASVIEAQTKNENKKIEMQLSGAVGDNFSVKIALENFSVIENFVL